MKLRNQWFVVAILVIAMAWLEAAVVMYLRFFIDRIVPYQVDPLPLIAELGEIELIREVATLVMLFCVGWLAGRGRYSRLGYFLIAFGLWDIFYYVFLRVIGGWPETVLDWDILFLLPLPWWGPVLAPVLVSLLMIVFGSLLSMAEGRHTSPTWWSWVAAIVGVFLALLVFMQEALKALPASITIIRAILPVDFNWWLFSLAIFLLAVPSLEVAFRLRTDRPRMLLHDR